MTSVEMEILVGSRLSWLAVWSRTGKKKQVASEAKITTSESQEAKDERSILTKDHLSWGMHKQNVVLGDGSVGVQVHQSRFLTYFFVVCLLVKSKRMFLGPLIFCFHQFNRIPTIDGRNTISRRQIADYEILRPSAISLALHGLQSWHRPSQLHRHQTFKAWTIVVS